MTGSDKPVRQRGFTLIELLVVLALVAIIGSIAMSAFSGAGEEGERSRIITEMNALNDAVGRYYQGNYSYNGVDLSQLRVTANIGASDKYLVTITPSDQGYLMVARPTSSGGMAGTGAYSIDEVGRRCYFPDNDTANPAVDGCPAKW